MLSIITVVNKKNIFQDHLYRTLQFQNYKTYELIEVSNCNKEFSSLGEAYTFGLSQSSGNLVMFIHPDIEFIECDSLRDIVNQAEYSLNNDIDICGVAGAKYDGTLVSSIFYGPDKRRYKESVKDIGCIIDTVDACCFIVRRDFFNKYVFGSYLSGFHMFVEDLCIQVHVHNKNVSVVNAKLWHLSPGASLDYTYYRNTRLLFKHYPFLNELHTTSFNWIRTPNLFNKLRFMEIRNKVHHIFDKK